MTAFACRRCGACCRVPGEVKLDADDLDALAEALQLDIADFTDRYTCLNRYRTGLSLAERADGSCVLLDADGACRVHAVKPRQCRGFPMSWRYPDTAAVCPAYRVMEAM